jgi:RNA polymerase sigma factor (sigma-70 family)
VSTSSEHRDWELRYRRYFPQVYRAVAGVVFDRESALDAVQDAFEIGLRQPPPSSANVAGWLFRVALNRARRQLRRNPLERLYLLTTTAPRDREFEEALNRVETGRLLSLLTERQRAVVVARYYLGLSQAEIAALLGIQRGTVGATITHALAKMREASHV